MSFDRRDVADLGDEVLHPGDIPFDEVEEARLVFCGLRLREQRTGIANRRQRVLQLVRQICRERLHRLEMMPQTSAQLLQRPRQVTDLVAPGGARELTLQSTVPIEKCGGLAAQPIDRADDGRGENQAQDRRRGQGGEKDLEEIQADLVERGQDAKRRL